MKTDAQIKADVLAELGWDPAVDAAHVGVAVNDGVVTLSGRLATLEQKHAVETAARRVGGVRAIALDLNVTLSSQDQRGDTELAEAVVNALRWNSLVPDDKVTAKVEDGWITLSGEVDWRYQHASAEQCIRPLVGVRGVTNHIVVKARADVKNIADQISAALTRRAQREAQHIAIEVDGSVVTLKGSVHTLSEHDAVVGTAMAARGVSRVVDQLEVGG